MDTATHKVHHLDAATGVVTERDATPEEIEAMPKPTTEQEPPTE